ncbi:MAG TPA: alkene reductase, partial [Solibacterales bacterium]|nr:alkene reductase [Bryobacterales bacterium]
MDMLFQNMKVGEIELPSRIVMAPLTRSRAVAGNAPNDLHVEYYRQRASAGLIVTEGTSPSANGLGYARTALPISDAQIAGWKNVTDAVHAAGGRIFLQIMHVGRIAHPLNQPAGARILAPSAIAPKVEMWTDEKAMQPIPAPEAMSVDDIRATIAEFSQGARNAQQAGFDGLELHSANGYLPNQFLSPNANQRTDEYGGSIENRVRFTLEVFDALAEVWGPGR